MGVSNPVQATLEILSLIDEVRAKMEGTRLAAVPWRPASPGAAQDLTDLVLEPLKRCEDPTEVLIVVTVAAVLAGARQSRQS